MAREREADHVAENAVTANEYYYCVVKLSHHFG
jgi:hypothetical protein